MQTTKWMVRENIVCGKTMYQIYRMVGKTAQVHGGPWKDKEEAEAQCFQMNMTMRGFRGEVMP